MKTIQIEIPDGFNASFDKASGKIEFQPKKGNVLDRIKTVDDVLADHGLTQAQFKNHIGKIDGDEEAYKLLKLLAKSLNEGWTPDWNDENQPKYVPWFEMGGPSGFRFAGYAYWFSYSSVGSRLCFKTRELAEYAGQQFIEVYKQFMLI